MGNRLRKKFEEHSRSGKKGLILLVDPDKLDQPGKDQRFQFAKEFAEMIFIGGSMTHKDISEESLKKIKVLTGLPVIIFPANSMHVNPGADAILFLSLLSGRNPEYLVGHHVAAAPYLKKSGLEVIPSSYLLIGTGQATTAEYITQTAPIPYNKPEIAATTALAGEYMGKSLTYLDAGSGAERPISSEMVQAVREQTSNPLIVGGGIRNPDKAEELFEAGADYLVIGNILEEDPGIALEFGLMIKGLQLRQES